MSLVSGLANIKIPFTIPLATPNASGLYAGNNNVFTTLTRGTYMINWNPRITPVTPTNQITQFQMALTINQPFGVVGSVFLATSPLCGVIGQQAGNSITWTLSNMFTITADNTPMYVYLNVVVANTTAPNTWYMGQSADVQNLDDIDITRIC